MEYEKEKENDKMKNRIFENNEAIHELDFVKNHPVSKIFWIPVQMIQANDYNPNTVPRIEMDLLQLSIESDGYTQPIVVWKVETDMYEVVDGFHRYLNGKDKLKLTHLPCVIINKEREDRTNRIASTIRHNRARGKHKISGMSNIVIELSKRNWSDERIAKELGMDADEVLRLKQITGLAELFKDEDFSKAWE